MQTGESQKSNDQTKRSLHTSDHLANERTYLAWIRTSIAVIGLGFVVARFGVWLRELTTRLGGPQAAPAKHSGLSLPMGVGMMAIGGLLAIMAAARYRQVRVAIDRDEPVIRSHAVTVATVVVVAIAAAMAGYMLASG